MANITVEHWGTTDEMIQNLQDRGFSPSQYVYSPGTAFPPHTHDTDKIATVLSGRFRITMDGQSFILEKGNGILVPRGTVHSAEVVGNEAVVSVDAPKL